MVKPNPKTSTLNELLLLSRILLVKLKLPVFILQREVGNERVNVCVWNALGMCASTMQIN